MLDIGSSMVHHVRIMSNRNKGSNLCLAFQGYNSFIHSKYFAMFLHLKFREECLLFCHDGAQQ